MYQTMVLGHALSLVTFANSNWPIMALLLSLTLITATSSCMHSDMPGVSLTTEQIHWLAEDEAAAADRAM